jgi:hypothetical protein
MRPQHILGLVLITVFVILAILALFNGAYIWAIAWVICAVLVAASTGGIKA